MDEAKVVKTVDEDHISKMLELEPFMASGGPVNSGGVVQIDGGVNHMLANLSAGASELEDDDESIVTPAELQVIEVKGSFNLEKVKTMMKGPICWKCYTWGIFFSCKECGRHFHRECVFMNHQFPYPVFDKSLEEACSAAWGEVNILKCPICIVSEETRVSRLRGVTVEDLNKALYYVTTLIESERGGDLLAKFPCGDKAITVKEIREKAANNAYKTVEGYYADFVSILYNIISKYSRESEGTVVAKTEMKAVCLELRVMIACLECTLRRFTPDGKLLLKQENDAQMKLPCNVPHVVIWVKDGLFSFWPAKMLGIDILNGVKTVLVQYFGEKSNPLFIAFSDPNYKLMKFSRKYPGPDGKIPSKLSSSKVKSWRSSMSLCEGYLRNLKSKYGDEGVIVPDESAELTGNSELSAYILEMFPMAHVPPK